MPTTAAPADGQRPPAVTLSRRTLNRTTLQRQLLLHRVRQPALDTVAHLTAVQGQEPDAPYVGLWTRLEDFHTDELTGLLHDRRVVRGSLLRGTQHLAAADDYPWLRPLVQPVLDRAQRGTFGRATAGLDLTELAASVRRQLGGRTLTRPQLRDLLAARWPDRDRMALIWTAQALLPIVHPPPSGVWRRRGAVPFALAEDWLGRPLAASPQPEQLFRRYLAAFGPASVADIQVWSGLTRLAEVAERLRGELRTFRDEAGRELLDLPDAPLADPDTPAPVRFLPEFDNLLIGHADRTRVVSDADRKRVITGAVVRPTILVDGFVRGTWAIIRTPGTATLVIDLYEPLAAADHTALLAEGHRLLTFAAADTGSQDIQFAALP